MSLDLSMHKIKDAKKKLFALDLFLFAEFCTSVIFPVFALVALPTYFFAAILLLGAAIDTALDEQRDRIRGQK